MSPFTLALREGGGGADGGGGGEAPGPLWPTLSLPAAANGAPARRIPELGGLGIPPTPGDADQPNILDAHPHPVTQQLSVRPPPTRFPLELPPCLRPRRGRDGTSRPRAFPATGSGQGSGLSRTRASGLQFLDTSELVVCVTCAPRGCRGNGAVCADGSGISGV